MKTGIVKEIINMANNFYFEMSSIVGDEEKRYESISYKSFEDAFRGFAFLKIWEDIKLTKEVKFWKEGQSKVIMYQT